MFGVVPTEGTQMKHKDIENKLALLGAIVVLIGVSSAATSALAFDGFAADNVVSSNEIARVTAEGGRQANRRIAEAALETMMQNNGIDLDIELTNRTSQSVADAR